MGTCPVARAAARGDVNGDGAADGRDIGVLTGLITGAADDPAARARADLNCDGRVDFADAEILLRGLRDGFPRIESDPRGDIDGDGRRDGRDISLFAWVMTGVDTNAQHVFAADVNADGVTDAADLPAFVNLLVAGPIDPAAPAARMGDVNGDSARDGRDVQAFIYVLTGVDVEPSHLAAADFNHDGVVSIDDATMFMDKLLAEPSNPNLAWIPPIGVPMPPFGVRESHYMFVGQTFDFGYGCEPYRDAGHGPFTHYIDNTSPNATDSDNPFGTPARPRYSIPFDLLPGSVVEVHGGPYEQYFEIRAIGTPARPIFIRGADPMNPPLFKVKILVLRPAEYVIVENLAVDRDYQSSGVNVQAAHYCCVRNCDITDVQGGILAYGDDDETLHDVVLLNNHIHDLGDLSVPEDIDDNGILVGGDSYNVWVMDNLVHHTVGSGIVLNPGFGEDNSSINHVYIGRNTVHHTRQSGCWTKESSDAVFSQNTCYGIFGTAFAQSIGLGFQYGPERTWFIFNHVYDCEYGVGSGSNNVPNPGVEQFFVGNVFHDITHQSAGYDPNNPWSSAAMQLVGGLNRYIVNNTIYRCDAGINGAGNGSYFMDNNVISDILQPDANHVFIENISDTVAWDIRNSCLDATGTTVRVRQRNQVYDLTRLANELGKGSGCISTAPGFANAEGLDFHLLPGSPAIDTGLPAQVYARFEALYGLDISVDYDNTPRPDGAAFDMGALETH